MVKKSKPPIPTEYDEQIVFVDWLERRGLAFSAIPNSTYSEHWGVKMRNRRLGLRKGLPDLLVAIPGKCLAFVEMKRIRASYATQEQKEWIDLLNTIPNVEGRVCRGAKEAIDFITSIL